MKYFKKFLNVLDKERSYLKDLFIVVIITRLLFLEDNTIMILAEIISGLVLIFHPSHSKDISEE
jgi:hypothetical protein